jgi:hypothetical protein
LARRESNPRPGPYKDPALTAELRARASRAGGNRTHTLRIKSPLCYQLHHNPANRSGVSVSIAMRTALSFSFMLAVSSVVALRIELSATRLSAVSGQPALDYRFTFLSVGAYTHRKCATLAQWAGRRSNPRLLVFSQALYRLSYRPVFVPCVATSACGGRCLGTAF